MRPAASLTRRARDGAAEAYFEPNRVQRMSGSGFLVLRVRSQLESVKSTRITTC